MPALLPDFHDYDALGLAGLIRKGSITPLELLEEVIRRIQSVNGTLNCICYPAYEQARRAAQKPLPPGPFSGLPLFLKDLILWHKGTPISSGSRYLKDFIAPETSEVVRRLLASGMIFTARTTSAEFGALPTVESRCWGVTRNPWNPEYSTGGSSGGAAALVAARIFPLADGNDGGGSVRGPAALCGLVGLKPSRGRHSFAPFGDWRFSMGVCGCLCLSVRDAAAYLDVISGCLPGELNALPTPAGSFLHGLQRRKPARLRIGLAQSAFPVDTDCREAAEDAARLCESLGHAVAPFDLPDWSREVGGIFQKTGAVWTALRIARQAALMGRLPEEDELEPVTWASWQLGRRIPAVEHEAVLEEMRKLGQRMAATLEAYDVVLTPTLAAPAFRLGHMNPSAEELPHLADSLCARSWTDFGRFLTMLNVTGQPGISLPLAWNKEGFPLGVQLIGRHAGEQALLNLAADLEGVRPWMGRVPPLHAHA